MIEISPEETGAADIMQAVEDKEKVERLCSTINKVLNEQGLSLADSCFAMMIVMSRGIAETAPSEEMVVESADVWSKALSGAMKAAWNTRVTRRPGEEVH